MLEHNEPFKESIYCSSCRVHIPGVLGVPDDVLDTPMVPLMFLMISFMFLEVPKDVLRSLLHVPDGVVNVPDGVFNVLDHPGSFLLSDVALHG